MCRYFKLSASRIELCALHALLGLAAVLAIAYLQSGLLQLIYLSAIALLAVGETRRSRNAPVAYLCVDGERCGMVAETGGQPYFAHKYKVYRTRWFAILKLWNRNDTRTEMLFPDRFESVRDYQDCRFLLRGQGQS